MEHHVKTGLVVEGGGMKCAYNAGILDAFIDHGISFDYCIGGMDAADSEANYVFFRAPRPGLREFLLDRGILIRSCANYPGLDEYDFRAAVRLPQENSRFLAACRGF